MTARPSAEVHVAPAMSRTMTAVIVWLWGVAALVFAMIVVGGATRLTDSGLSITEWQPLLGAIPPFTAEHWQDAFDKYRQIPEYKLVNKGMSLDEFKVIYWWEWSHRFLGRFIGLAFAIPLIYFWVKGSVRGRLKWRLLGIFLLGGLQGAVGWYMVKSGLVDRVDVSQYRLALHLLLAFLIFGLLVWTALDCQAPPQAFGARSGATILSVLAATLVVCFYLQVVLGAFVAGTKAGLAYTTWPTMNGEWMPSDMGQLTPWYRNVFEDVATIQFNHRLMAYVIGVLALVNLVIAIVRRSGWLVLSSSVLFAAVGVQMAVGIWTLLKAVPIELGLAHQGGAAIVLAIALWHWHRTRRSAQVAVASR
jgi:heme a synthase